MKALLLATAMFAAPLVAQMTPPAEPTPQTQPTTDRATTPTESAPQDPSQPAPGAMPAETANTTAQGQAAAATITAPAGATNVVFQQPQTVEQAFPPPPPKADYPWCTQTVTDGCKQRRDPK